MRTEIKHNGGKHERERAEEEIEGGEKRGRDIVSWAD